MKRIVLSFLVILFGLIILAQFFQPEKNNGERDILTDLFQNASINDTLKTLLTNSCYDCHSNRTIYPLYSKISPISWYLYDHIKVGKESLNFSKWGSYPANEKISQLVDIGEILSDGEMPLKSYLLIHKNAILSKEEIQWIVNWTEEEGMRIMMNSHNTRMASA